MKTLLLIDANSLIHRAYHALPPLTAPDGKPSQALYGLSSILLKIFRENRPDYAAALFDRPEPTFRKKEYAEYKAQRPKADDALISQIIEAHHLFPAFGIPIFEEPGLEADDLIATFAETFKSKLELKIIILTGDMDTLQLVDDGKVFVCALKTGVSDTATYDRAAVIEKYGIAPEQLIDYKALAGDPSDNIKGVPGVGPKTAQRLLAEFGTLANIYNNIGRTGSAKEKLQTFREDAEQAKRLVTLVRNADTPTPNLDELAPAFDQEKITAYFNKFGFKTLLARLLSDGAGGTARPKNGAIKTRTLAPPQKEAQGKIF